VAPISQQKTQKVGGTNFTSKKRKWWVAPISPAKNAKGGWHQFHQQKTQMVGGTNFSTNFTSKKRKWWVAPIE
jgi:hypothetical protein